MTGNFGGSVLRSIWEERSPQLLGFCIFLEDNKCVDWQEAYMAESGIDRLTLVDAIVAWFVYSDGFMWCPRYIDFLEAVIRVGASWDEHDRRSVHHPSAVPDEQLLASPSTRIDLTAFTDPGSLVPFAPDFMRLIALLSQSTFERLRAVRKK